jgi:hypothetical protein
LRGKELASAENAELGKTATDQGTGNRFHASAVEKVFHDFPLCFLFVES